MDQNLEGGLYYCCLLYSNLFVFSLSFAIMATTTTAAIATATTTAWKEFCDLFKCCSFFFSILFTLHYQAKVFKCVLWKSHLRKVKILVNLGYCIKLNTQIPFMHIFFIKIKATLHNKGKNDGAT